MQTAVMRLVQADFRAMQLSDPAHDGEPEARARTVAPRRAVKSFEHAFAFLRRNTGAVVDHIEYDLLIAFAYLNFDGAAGRRVPNRVVDEVPQQNLQRPMTARHHSVAGLAQSDLDTFR